MAHALIARAHGNRPVNLVGYGLGARVIFYCLKELADHPQADFVLVHNVYLFGCAVSADLEAWQASDDCYVLGF